MNGLSRRQLLKYGLTGTAGAMAVPYVVPSGVLAADGRPGANERVTLGIIGLGGRAGQLICQLPQQAQIAAVADCFTNRCHETAKARKTNWRIHQDYRRLLDEKDIDAVIVATPDHNRVLACVLACQAGKDIYAEKPVSLYISEGRALVRAVQKYGRVVQVGSQQRSMQTNRIACEFVRNGGIGKIRRIRAVNFWASNPIPRLPEQPIPKDLDWDLWLGQASLRPYNDGLPFDWRRWWDYGGGDITNMGAHALDQVQWALGMDDTGPVEFWPVTPGQKDFVMGQKPATAASWPVVPGPNGKVSYRYANGVQVDVELEEKHGPDCGAIFTGEKGKIEINRNKFTTNPKKLVPNGPSEAEAAKWRVGAYQAGPHLQNWLDCIKTRKTPIASVEIGQRTASVCHLCNIARQVGRKITWDPEREQIVGDEEANRLLGRPRRKGYELPEVGA
jgi:predicted dehydrogenase